MLHDIININEQGNCLDVRDDISENYNYFTCFLVNL